ncbi:MAG: hypothetical protein HQK79_10570 [Desulfobacterales bacterium]|nr:hypothetical protein [Desulfobacterales bacterium]MBF0396359.1 hypothetical protein [Desulfobacterales bacterium]
MASPFVRTMRSFHADSYYASFIGILISMFFMTLWFIWFFTANVSIYKKSTYAVLTSQEGIKTDFPSSPFGIVNTMEEKRGKVVISEFPIDAKDIIKRGQNASFIVEDAVTHKRRKVPAIVTKLASQFPQKKIAVELIAFMDKKIFKEIKAGTTGQVNIEVNRETPAKMVMRMSGLFIN